MVSQDSQSQDALVSVDTASDGGPFLSAPHHSFTQHLLLPLFISLQDELKGQRNWNCGAIRKNLFFPTETFLPLQVGVLFPCTQVENL